LWEGVVVRGEGDSCVHRLGVNGSGCVKAVINGREKGADHGLHISGDGENSTRGDRLDYLKARGMARVPALQQSYGRISSFSNKEHMGTWGDPGGFP
jgi:hypothetical protein